MYYNQYYFQPPEDTNRFYILDLKRGDVNGDRFPEIVYLIGRKPYGMESPFTEDITLVIQDIRTFSSNSIPLEENAGYNPTLFLEDFTGDGINDILVSIDSGGSGGYAFYYIYSYLNNNPEEIFNSADFDEKYEYSVQYMDSYEVNVSPKDNSKTYILNIEYKGEEYLSEIYNSDGTLKEPIEGWVNPLGGLYPIDFQRDGTYELYATQRIAGRYNADNLGYVQTSLEWNGDEFVPFFQTVGVLG